MPRKEVTLLVARALALYLICWALADVTYVPERVLSLRHALSERGPLKSGPYYVLYYRETMIAAIVRILGLSFGAGILWKGGPGVQRLFAERERASDTDA